jgi:hypothetical protein
MAYPENPQDQNQENLEQKPINPENDWVSKVTEKDFKEMTPEQKQEALDNLSKELKEKYEHVGPDAEWGADNVAPEKGIIKPEKGRVEIIKPEKGNVEIQSRDEFLDQHLEQYSKAKFPEDNYVAKGSLNKFKEEEMKKSLNGEKLDLDAEEKFKDEQLEKFIKEKYPDSQNKLETESIQEQSRHQNLYQEQLNQNEYENIAEKTIEGKDLETQTNENVDKLSEEQLKEVEKDAFEQYDQMRGETEQDQYIKEQPKGETDQLQEQLKENEYENKSEQIFKPEDVEYPRAENPDELTEEEREQKEKEIFEQEEKIRESSANKDQQQEQLKEYQKIEEELQNKEQTKPKKKEGWLTRVWKGFASWFEKSAVDFVFSIPARIYDFIDFIWQWADNTLKGNGSWAGKEIEKRGNKKLEKVRKDWDKMKGGK